MPLVLPYLFFNVSIHVSINPSLMKFKVNCRYQYNLSLKTAVCILYLRLRYMFTFFPFDGKFANYDTHKS